MKQRLADYIANFLVANGITDCFSVVGGGAMHLNDAFGHKEGLHCTYNHHEQACAIAAEAYARLNNKIAALTTVTMILVSYVVTDAPSVTGMQAPVAHHKEEL